MKNRVLNTMKKNRWFAFGILALITLFMVAFAPVMSLGVTGAFALMVGGVEFSGEDEKTASAFVTEMENIAKKHAAGYISETRMNELMTQKMAEFAKTNSEELAKTIEQLNAIGLELKSIKESGTKKEIYKSFVNQALDQIASKGVEEMCKEKFELKIDLKKANGLSIYTKQVGTVVANEGGMSSYDTTWSYEPLNPPVIRQYSNTMTTALPVITYYDLGAREGGAGVTSEGSAKTQSDATPVPVHVHPFKLTSYWDITEEATQDLPGMLAEMQRELLDQINAKEDSEFIAILDGSPAFSTTGLTFLTPGIADVILACKTQIKKAKFKPNICVLNPTDYANFLADKDDVGAYRVPPFGSATNVNGVDVIEDDQIEVGHILVGDFTKFNVRDYKTFTVRFGYSGDNFKANIMTAVGEKRVFGYIKTSHAKAFVYDEIADIKTAITVS